MAQLGRNEPCHCRSGKKYKQCCMDKDAERARKNRINYDMPLLVDGESRAECDPEYMTEEEQREWEKEIRLLGHTEEQIQADNGPVGIGVSKEDNHITHMTGEAVVKSFVLSRTLADDEYAKPEYAAKGFTWYIREAPAHGSQAVAFFKDVRTACYGMELLARFEWECQQDAWQEEDDDGDAPPPEDYPIEHDLNWLRRLLVSEHDWTLLPEL